MTKICVIGNGRWGKNHVATLKEMGCEVSTVDPVTVATYDSLDQVDLLAYDGFVVASSAETHYKIGLKLLNAGRPVLIEKPVALSRGQTNVLVKAAKLHNATLMVGHLFLFHPAILKIKEMLPQLGRVMFIHSTRLNFGVLRTTEDVLWGLMPHDLSIIDFFVDGEVPTKVTAAKFGGVQDTVADSAVVSLQYASVQATIHTSWLWPKKERKLTVIGTEGMLEFDMATLTHYTHRVEGTTLVSGYARPISFDSTSPMRLELEHFLSHLDSPSEIVGPEHCMNITTLIERINRVS